MRYLGLALFAEGRTDHSFLVPLLRRLTDEVCRRRVTEPVEVSNVLSLTSRSPSSEESRVDRILEAARLAWPQWHILFVHADANGDAKRSRSERVEPGLRALRQQFEDHQGFGVGVVPVRMTEAWLLADGDALRGALGFKLTDEELGVPVSPKDVESFSDPKSVFTSACRQHRRSRGPHPTVYLPRLGETASLEILAEVPAFRRLQDDLVEALRDLRILS